MMTAELALRHFSPAQVLFILRPETFKNEFLKYTLMDLIVQERLSLVNFDADPVHGESKLGFTKVVTGKKFQIEPAKLHEMVFLFPFYRKKSSRIVMKHLLQMGLNAAKTESYFKGRLLLDDQEMKPLFQKTWWQKIWGGQQLSDAGKKLQADLIRLLNYYDKELPRMLKEEKENASAILKMIKGNTLLMNSFKFHLIEMIGKELLAVETELEEGVSNS
jgi:hypothetical protein